MGLKLNLVKAVRCAYGFHSLNIGGRASVTLSQVDRNVFGVLVVGVAVALGRAVAAIGYFGPLDHRHSPQPLPIISPAPVASPAPSHPLQTLGFQPCSLA